MLRGGIGSVRAELLNVYWVSDQLTGILIFLMVIFSPWAFGTTEPWSIWTMNIAGYVLGALLAVKRLSRSASGNLPARWDSPGISQGDTVGSAPGLSANKVTWGLGLLTLGLLGYCLLSALNARATFYDRSLAFDYHRCLAWLPHSFDSTATWQALRSYLAFACSFWAVRDWLLGKSSGEERAGWQGAKPVQDAPGPPLPARLRRLLWLLAINGALLGLEGIVQRLEQSPRLLFLVRPRIHQTAISQFGPYAYRSNAAEYLNLVWPVAVGFWWTLNRAGSRRRSHHLLLACGAIIAACPLISTSRGGALVAAGLLAAASLVLLFSGSLLRTGSRQYEKKGLLTLGMLSVFLAGTLALGLALGWRALKPRMARLEEGLALREELYAAARPMAADFPWFGTGPGSFETVSQLYPRPAIFWPAQLHNDWLEIRLTFGWVGCALLAGMVICVLMRWFAPGGIHGPRRFVLLLWVALAGCAAHAQFDFPLQVYSIQFLVVLLGAVLFTLSRVNPLRDRRHSNPCTYNNSDNRRCRGGRS